FHQNVSGMKKLAAQDFEDIIQCIIPAVSGLLDQPHNNIVQDLIFELATWHALAKLWLHTEETLQILEHTTRSVGQVVYQFLATMCEYYDTEELKEEAARGWHTTALTANAMSQKVRDK
ncbi:hypothetical protein WOLCODRAFT_81987, partial [Wolfiporia cocos MD-104 SS10]